MLKAVFGAPVFMLLLFLLDANQQLLSPSFIWGSFIVVYAIVFPGLILYGRWCRTLEKRAAIERDTPGPGLSVPEAFYGYSGSHHPGID